MNKTVFGILIKMIILFGMLHKQSSIYCQNNFTKMSPKTCKLKNLLADSFGLKIHRLFAIGKINNNIFKVGNYSSSEVIDGNTASGIVTQYKIGTKQRFSIGTYDSSVFHYITFTFSPYKKVVLKFKDKFTIRFLGYLLKNQEHRFYFQIQYDNCKSYFSLLLYDHDKLSLTEYDN